MGALVLLATALVATVRHGRTQPAELVTFKPETMNDFKKPDATELKQTLSSEQFRVTQQCGTEPPYRNAYWDNHKPGLYVDVVSGEPLFSSSGVRFQPAELRGIAELLLSDARSHDS